MARGVPGRVAIVFATRSSVVDRVVARRRCALVNNFAFFSFLRAFRHSAFFCHDWSMEEPTTEQNPTVQNLPENTGIITDVSVDLGGVNSVSEWDGPVKTEDDHAEKKVKDEPSWLQAASNALKDENQSHYTDRSSKLDADSEAILSHLKAIEQIVLKRPENTQVPVIKRPVQRLEQTARRRFNRR